MAELESRLPRVSPRGSLGPDPRTVASGFFGLARGLEQAGAVASRFAAERLASGRKANYAKGSALIENALLDLRIETATDPHPETLPERMQQRGEVILNDLISEMGYDDVVSSGLLNYGTSALTRHVVSTIKDAQKAVANSQLAAASEVSEQYATSILATDSPQGRAELLANGKAAILSMDMIPLDVREALSQKFELDVAREFTQKLAADGDFDTAVQVANQIPGINAEERQNLLSSIATERTRQHSARRMQEDTTNLNLTIDFMDRIADRSPGALENLPTEQEIIRSGITSPETINSLRAQLRSRIAGADVPSFNVAAVKNAIDLVNANVITDESQLADLFMDLGKEGYSFVVSRLNRKLTKDPFSVRLQSFLDQHEAMVTASVIGSLDPNGDRNFFHFEESVNATVDRYKREGRDLMPLVTTTSPEYLGKTTLPAFQRDLSQQISEYVDLLNPQTPERAMAIQNLPSRLLGESDIDFAERLRQHGTTETKVEVPPSRESPGPESKEDIPTASSTVNALRSLQDFANLTGKERRDLITGAISERFGSFMSELEKDLQKHEETFQGNMDLFREFLTASSDFEASE